MRRWLMPGAGLGPPAINPPFSSSRQQHWVGCGWPESHAKPDGAQVAPDRGQSTVMGNRPPDVLVVEDQAVVVHFECGREVA
jgi:hypothetical protein